MTRGGHNMNSMKTQYAPRLSLKECMMSTDLYAHMLVRTNCLRKFCFLFHFRYHYLQKEELFVLELQVIAVDHSFELQR